MRWVMSWMYAATGIAVLFVGSSVAQADGTWSGFYIGGGGGIGSLNAEAKLNSTSTTDTFETCRIVPNAQPDPRNVGDCPGPVFPVGSVVGDVSNPFNAVMGAPVSALQSFSPNDGNWIGTAFIGVDQQVGQGVVGAFADISWVGADTSFDFGPALGTFSLGIDYLVTVGGRVGLLTFDQAALAYIYGGYTYAEMDSPLINNANGFSVGLGGEGQLGGGWFARIDARYTRLGSERFNLGSITDAPVVTPVGPNGGVWTTCNGLAGVDCVHEETSTTTTSHRGSIESDIFALQFQLGYRF